MESVHCVSVCPLAGIDSRSYWYIDFHIKSAEETATSSASLEESAGAFYYFVINFVSLNPTGGLVPSEIPN